ncbi:MAG: efflux RND transporter permease subunit [Desulfobacteraceae bacterium]|nr:efflux RND transporter permease subunit [Desulfobacteraceae bacterium]
MNSLEREPKSFLEKLIWFCLNQKLVVFSGLIMIMGWGLMVAPFKWDLNIPQNPVAVDAIPDIGENQQIVFTKWPGRSPQDVEDQITYPLTVALLGVPEVKTVRSFSMFGFSSIYIVFKEKADFYWSRTRILEKLNSLSPGTLPQGVNPALGPDATALGQVFWYTLEGYDEKDNLTGGWDLDELRSIQDWQVKYSLLSADGVSEVASIGGFVKEYQIDIDPFSLKHYGIKLEDVFMAVKMSNQDIGAKTIEVNRSEYVIRGIGFIKGLKDIENAVIKTIDNTPVYVKQVANVSEGPALRRGVLDKEGAEVVGGVVIARYGANPLKTIENLKQKIKEIEPGLPEKMLRDGKTSKLKIVPFYDRSGLIHETLGTLSKALTEEILITLIVVLLLILNIRSSVLISAMLPLSVLMVFIAMKQFGVDASIVALSGIAIAIGTIVDMGIVMTENIIKRLGEASPDQSNLSVIYEAANEVGSAIITAVATTVISFIPVFTMTGAEGKLFKPLAFTKTFALLASIIIAIVLLPAFAHLFFGKKYKWTEHPLIIKLSTYSTWANRCLVTLGVILLAKKWLPLGPEKGTILNIIFVGFMIGCILGSIIAFQRYYSRLLVWCLENKLKFMAIPGVFIIAGLLSWASLGKEFMPALDEGAFLYMPTTMTHASITEATDVLQKQDMAFAQIPEVESAVGKSGRVDSALDPAPISMIETIINYKSEFIADKDGNRLRFKFTKKENDYFRNQKGDLVLAKDGKPYRVKGKFIRDENNNLVPDKNGKPFRLWRPALNPKLNEDRSYWAGIKTPNDIWDEIQKAAQIPGTTSAPKLQPIEARIVMLQSGVRAPMAIKIKGPDLETIESFGLTLEKHIKEASFVEPAAVFADRVVGKPYYEIHIDREKIARYGVMLNKVQNAISMAVGGKVITQTVEGRERYPIRIRYQRELRDNLESLGQILIDTRHDTQIPLTQLAEIKFVKGPQVIKSEDTFLTSYVLFDKKPKIAEMDTINQVQKLLNKKIASGVIQVPNGISFAFTGNYENLIRSEKTLKIVLPLALFLIFIILYLQFKSISLTSLVFSGIFLAWSGGFIMIWLYGQSWFLNFPFMGEFLRDLFQIHPINLSVAVWVGFLALFGIASDNGVIMGEFLKESFKKNQPKTIQDIRKATIEAGNRRVRPCLMTTATTILALLPVLTSSGRGADIMVPMAIPSFGGMFVATVTLLMVPVIYSWIEENKLKRLEQIF